MKKRISGLDKGRCALIEMLESRQLLSAGNIVVDSQNYAPLQLYSQAGVLLATGGTYPTQSSPGAGDGGSAGAIVVDKNDNIQMFTGGFNPFLQRQNGLLGGSGGWTTEQTTGNVPGWSLVGRTFYGGLATVGNYVFATDMSTGSGGGSNGLIRFNAASNYAPTRFASGVDYSDVTLGMDGYIYGLVSPGGQPENGTVNVFDPNTLAVIRTIQLTDFDDAAVVADAQGNIYTGAFDGTTRKISPAGVVLDSIPIASTDLDISSDGKILSCAGGTVRILDENLNILGAFNVSSPLGAAFVTWDNYQAPNATPVGTSTSITSSGGSSVFGQSITLTATVTPDGGSGPSGSVQFMNGATPLGNPVTLDSNTGAAVYYTSALTAGTDSITAVYSGDGNYATSTSLATTITVTKVTPTVTVSDAGGAYTGSPFPATALVGGAAKLEGIAPTVAYYTGSTPTGTPSASAPSAGGTYTVVASYPGSTDYNSASSSAVTFNIVVPPAAPAITTQPESQSVLADQTVNLIANASGYPTPFIEWQYSSDGGSTYINITGATNPTYSFSALLSQTGYLYEAVFTNSQGTATTNPVTLTVSTAPTPPVVTTDPTDQTVPTGQTGTFTAAGVGLPAPTVQWQISTNGGTSFANINGANSTTYNFTAGTGQDGDLFRAVFTNSQGTANSAAATLTLAPPLTSPVVATDPSDQTALSGNTVTFTAAATGNPAPTVQWQYSTDGTTFTDISGATSTTLSLTVTSDQDGDTYRAVFTNSQGSIATAPASLSVTPTQFVVSAPPPDSIAAGQTFGFSVRVMDSSGNLDTGFTGDATVSLAAGASGSLGGQLTVPVTDGVATFSGLTIDTVGSPALVVSSAAATTATTPPVDVSTPLSDVIPTLSHVSLPPSAILGGKLNAHMTVALGNTGPQQKGVFTIHLFADTANALDGNQQPLLTFAKKLVLPDGKGKSFAAVIKTLPTSLPAGTYHILAEVVDPTGATNVTSTSNTFVAAAPFVHIIATAGAISPATIAANHTGSIAVTVTNTGNVSSTGSITITLSPSTDGNSALPITLSTLSSLGKIAPGKSKIYRLHFKSTGQLVAGSYFPFVSLSLDAQDVTAIGPVQFTIE